MNCLEGVKARNPKQINARAFADVHICFSSSLVNFDFSRLRSSYERYILLKMSICFLLVVF
jgi:hypothetical protein